jgi:ABC-2 type transport system permease protein
LLRFPVLADLYDQRSGLAAWIVGTAVAALFITSIAKQTGQLVAQTPGMSGYLAVMGGEATITRGIVGQAGYSVVQTMLAIYALTAVSRWAADDQEGRLEMVLSRPVARWRVVVERAFALALGILLIIAGASLAVALVAPGQGVAVSAGDLFRAGLPLLPGAMLFGTLGAVFTARFPRIAVWAMGGYLVAAYLITQLGPLLGWPAWAIDLSVIRYYGDPLVSGIDWTGFWIMTAVAAAGFALALGAMQRREVGR